MKTHTTHLTRRAIEANMASGYTTLRDTACPALYFRFNRARTGGTFFAVKRPGENLPARWLRLGTYDSMKINTARQAAGIKVERLQTCKPIEPDDHQILRSVHDVLNWYAARREREKELSVSTRKNTRSAINRATRYLPAGPASSLNVSQLNQQLYEPMLNDYCLSTFENTLKVIKAAYVRACALKMIPSNPLATIQYKDFATRKPKPRDGRLDESGIRGILKSIQGAPLRTRMLIAWLLMHGTRVGETAQAHTARIGNGLWEIRESEAKTQMNEIPLTVISQQVLARYRSIQRHKYGSRAGYLFAQKHNRRRPISASHASNMVRDATDNKISPHDLRKRARTWWNQNGVDYFIGELLIGHQPGGLDKTYIQEIAIERGRDALTKWHEYLVSQGLMELIK